MPRYRFCHRHGVVPDSHRCGRWQHGSTRQWGNQRARRARRTTDLHPPRLQRPLHRGASHRRCPCSSGVLRAQPPRPRFLAWQHADTPPGLREKNRRGVPREARAGPTGPLRAVPIWRGAAGANSARREQDVVPESGRSLLSRDAYVLASVLRLPSSPRRYWVLGVASFDDEVVFAVGREELDHVAVRVDDGTDRRDRGEHRDAGG